MTIGASIFLIAVGAILRYAVTATVAGIEIQTVGLILMIAGIVGLLIGLFVLISDRNRTERVYDERDRLRRSAERSVADPAPPSAGRYFSAAGQMMR